MDVRLGALRLYRRHLVAQYSDRCSFYSLRDISGEAFSRGITIATDGADQDHWFRFITRCVHWSLKFLQSVGRMFL